MVIDLTATVASKPTKDIVYKRHSCGPQPTVPKKCKLIELKEALDVEGFLEKIKEVAPTARIFTLTTCKPQVNATPTENVNGSSHHVEEEPLTLTLQTPLVAFTSRLLSRKGFKHESVECLAGTLFEKLSIAENEARRIEVATRNQACCPIWYQHRKGRITASLFKDVCRSKRVHCTTLLNKIFNAQPLNVPAVQYGVENEPVAKERLLAHLSTIHSNARIEACGLMVNPRYPFFGCSPDGIFRCDCHQPALVEIKCLYSLRDCHPENLLAEGQKKKEFCLAANGALKETHAYYYQVQAQLHLNLENIRTCYFYIHVDAGGLLVVVERDENFMDSHIDSLHSFLRDIVLPRIILGNSL
ncbi:uncharacterized protein LOC125939794 [Dermacentor silvarum]|uniref:uncharacterized protein LOC125939794 n=1 Tax=Dermacentor silvarum TaxID=543639 RepID=UPI002100A820|nr:uncharacterized protein LOC125939794 [Dermacentor silvarum]